MAGSTSEFIFAMMRAGMPVRAFCASRSIRAIIRDMDEAEAKGESYRINLERGTIDPLKEADLFESEWKGAHGHLTQQEIANKYNVSLPYVSARIGTLDVKKRLAKRVEKITTRVVNPISASALERLSTAKPETWEKIIKNSIETKPCQPSRQ